MESVHALKGNNLIVRYLEDVKHKLELREMSSGKPLKTYNIPIGSISHLSCRREDSDFFFKLTSFTNPGVAYHCQLEKENEPYILHRTVVDSIREEDFVTTQVGERRDRGKKGTRGEGEQNMEMHLRSSLVPLLSLDDQTILLF